MPESRMSLKCDVPEGIESLRAHQPASVLWRYLSNCELRVGYFPNSRLRLILRGAQQEGAGAQHFLGAGAQHFFGAGAQHFLATGAQQRCERR